MAHFSLAKNRSVQVEDEQGHRDGKDAIGKRCKSFQALTGDTIVNVLMYGSFSISSVNDNVSWIIFLILIRALRPRCSMERTRYERSQATHTCLFLNLSEQTLSMGIHPHSAGKGAAPAWERALPILRESLISTQGTRSNDDNARCLWLIVDEGDS